MATVQRDLSRFLSYVEPRGDCLIWTGGTSRGYGVFHVDGRIVKAHRWLWEQTKGPIPDGLELDHLCETPACVNPAHLEPVTHAENSRRASERMGAGRRRWAARITHCPAGHEYTPENTAVHNGCRSCKTCRRDRRRAQRGGYKGMGPPGERTHCPHGHPYDAQNTYVWRGIRYCRACRSARRPARA